MSSKTSTVGSGVGQALEEEPPGREEVLPVAGRAAPRGRAGARAAARPSCAPRRRADARSSVARSFSPRRVGVLVLARSGSASAPSRPAPSRRRPRRRRGSGRGATRRCSTRPSMYFSNSQASRDLPIPAMPDDRDELGAAVLGRGVEEVLDQPQLAVAADERRLETGRLELRPPRRRPRAERAKSGTGSALPFSSCAPASLVRDRRLRGAPRRLADEHRARARRPTGRARRC